MTLDYTMAAIFGGLPCTSNECTSVDYLYACGLLPPRHPVPAVRESNCLCGWRETIDPCDCDCGLFKR